MAAGFAVVPVAAQVDLQRQQTVGRGTILAALIWDTVSTGARFQTWVKRSTRSGYFTAITDRRKKHLRSQFRPSVWSVTWWLSRAGLQGAGLFGHRFGERVTASDQLPALVALHIPHPHAYTARLGALRRRGSTDSGKGTCGGSVSVLNSPQTRGSCTT